MKAAPEMGQAFQRAARLGFPSFITPIGKSTPFNALPYLTSLADFRAVAATSPGRERLLDTLCATSSEAVSCGAEIESILIGGSFVDLKCSSPRDIDCICFYSRHHAHEVVDAGRLAALQEQARAGGVDVRFVPRDGDPLLLIKVVCYFTSLYSQSREGDGKGLRRGMILIDCSADGAR